MKYKEFYSKECNRGSKEVFAKDGQVQVSVVGMKYREDVYRFYPLLVPGAELELRRERYNIFDSDAVIVSLGQYEIGYVASEDIPLVRESLKKEGKLKAKIKEKLWSSVVIIVDIPDETEGWVIEHYPFEPFGSKEEEYEVYTFDELLIGFKEEDIREIIALKVYMESFGKRFVFQAIMTFGVIAEIINPLLRSKKTCIVVDEKAIEMISEEELSTFVFLERVKRVDYLDHTWMATFTIGSFLNDSKKSVLEENDRMKQFYEEYLKDFDW